MAINDKFIRGWVAGSLGGLSGILFGLLPYSLGISSLRLSDWGAILMYGRVPPFSLADQIYAIIILSGSSGVIGIIFAYLLLLINEKNIYFKGWIFFILPWWIVYFLTALAKTDGTLNLSVLTTLSDGISISIAGLAAVFFMRLFEPKSSASVSHPK